MILGSGQRDVSEAVDTGRLEAFSDGVFAMATEGRPAWADSRTPPMCRGLDHASVRSSRAMATACSIDSDLPWTQATANASSPRSTRMARTA